MISLQPENNEYPKKGKLLISEPFMDDPMFKRSVVLLCAHKDNEGSFGFVVNKYVNMNLQDIVSDFPTFEGKIALGGPVDKQSLYFVHTRNDIFPESQEIVEGLYLGGDFDVLKLHLNLKTINSSEVRFFLGYSGWGKFQLKEEIKEKSWLVTTKTNPKFIMDFKDDSQWKAALKNMGGQFAHLANFPEDPSLN